MGRSSFPLFSAVIGLSVLVLTLAWAYAFTRIYTRPVTRVSPPLLDLSKRIPAPINLHIRTADGSVYQQPLPFPTGGQINSGTPYVLPFTANASGPVRRSISRMSANIRRALCPRLLSLSIGLQPDPVP